MYPSHLGKFTIAEHDPDWPASMTYRAEPPITVRGSMNPWQTEREREVWLAEEAAWTAILPKQREYRARIVTIQGLIGQLNWKVSELERTTGKKSGFGTAATYGTMLYSFAGGPYALAASLAKMGIDMIVGIGVKKRAKRIQEDIERLIAMIMREYAANEVVKSAIEMLVQTAEGIRASQPVRAAAAMAQSETAYQAARSLDNIRAAVLRERIRYVALLPRLAPGGSDAL